MEDHSQLCKGHTANEENLENQQLENTPCNSLGVPSHQEFTENKAKLLHSLRRTTPSSTLPFLSEIRLEIYKLLLLNPLLGKIESVANRLDERITKPKYDLHPVVLRLSKDVYEEASAVLYSQSFVLICTGEAIDKLWRSHMSLPTQWAHIPASPITRYFDHVAFHDEQTIYKPFDSTYHSIRYGTSVNKVRSWNIFYSPYTEVSERSESPYQLAGLVFNEFCKSICDQDVKHLHINLLNRHLVTDQQGSQTLAKLANEPPSSFLGHLTLLRKVEQLTIEGVDVSDHRLLDYRVPPRCDHAYLRFPKKYLVKMLQSLGESNRPVERLFEMNHLLVEFVQTFERCPFFKAIIGATYTSAGSFDDSVAGYALPDIAPEDPICYPFATSIVDINLRSAAIACKELNSACFKRQRKEIVRKLEMQYNRIDAASKTLNNYVKQQKTFCGILDPYIRNGQSVIKRNKGPILYLDIPEDSIKNDKVRDAYRNIEGPSAMGRRAIAMLVILLQDYAAALSLEPDDNARINSALLKATFEALYSGLERDKIVARLSDMVRLASEDFQIAEFQDVFCAAVDDMDKQYFSIRKAWRDLFTKDSYNDKQCDIEYNEALLTEELVDWTVQEPLLGPLARKWHEGVSVSRHAGFWWNNLCFKLSCDNEDIWNWKYRNYDPKLDDTDDSEDLDMLEGASLRGRGHR